MRHSTDSTAIAHRRELFLEELGKTRNISQSARSLGISRRTAYTWRESDPEFAARWDDLMEDRVDSLEVKAFELAMAGNVELIKFLLKGWRAERYHERMQIAANVHSTVQQIQVTYDEAPPLPEDMAARFAAIQAPPPQDAPPDAVEGVAVELPPD